jgi:apolipoprotein D and lipocalin family protein
MQRFFKPNHIHFSTSCQLYDECYAMIVWSAKRISFIVFIVLQLVALWFVNQFVHANTSGPQAVSALSLPEYMGTWYEVARLPNLFQNDCKQGTRVYYHLNSKGQIVVKNQCALSRGGIKQSKALAWVPNPQKPGIWQFSFVQVFNQPVASVPYWVLDYRAGRYAIVGQPGKQFGWVLSRKPGLVAKDWVQVKQTLAKQGYNPCQFKVYDNEHTDVLSLCKVVGNL